MCIRDRTDTVSLVPRIHQQVMDISRHGSVIHDGYQPRQSVLIPSGEHSLVMEQYLLQASQTVSRFPLNGKKQFLQCLRENSPGLYRKAFSRKKGFPPYKGGKPEKEKMPFYSSSSASKAESSESKSLSRWAVNFFTRCWAGSGESTMCMVLPARRGAWSTCAMVFMSAMTLLKTS